MPPVAKRLGHDREVNTYLDTRIPMCGVDRRLFCFSSSKSEDGRIVLRDSRAESRRPSAQMTLQNDCEFTGVRWNPCLDNLFATSDNQGRVHLRDTRTSFGSDLAQRTRKPLEEVRLFLCFGWSSGSCGCLRSLGDSLSRRCRSHLTLRLPGRRLVLSLGTVKVGL